MRTCAGNRRGDDHAGRTSVHTAVGAVGVTTWLRTPVATSPASDTRPPAFDPQMHISTGLKLTATAAPKRGTKANHGEN